MLAFFAHLFLCKLLVSSALSHGFTPMLLSLFDPTQFPTLSASQLSIGQFMVENPRTQVANDTDDMPQPCASAIDTVMVSAPGPLSMCMVAPNVVAPRWLAYEPAGGPRTIAYTKFFGRTHSATVYDNSSGTSFTFLLPATICAERVVGNFENPKTGDIEHNATLASIYQSLALLGPTDLFNYTSSVLRKSIANLEAAITPAICNFRPGDGRSLLWINFRRFQPQDVKGWTINLLSVATAFGITILANVGPVTHVGPLAHVGVWGELAIIAVSASILFCLGLLLGNLQQSGRTNVYEAGLFNVAVIIAEYLTNYVVLLLQNTCFPELAITQENQAIAQNAAIGPGPLAIGPAAMPANAAEAQQQAAAAQAQPHAVMALGDDDCDYIGIRGLGIVK